MTNKKARYEIHIGLFVILQPNKANKIVHLTHYFIQLLWVIILNTFSFL
jgi:hypothetical protein